MLLCKSPTHVKAHPHISSKCQINAHGRMDGRIWNISKGSFQTADFSCQISINEYVISTVKPCNSMDCCVKKFSSITWCIILAFKCLAFIILFLWWILFKMLEDVEKKIIVTPPSLRTSNWIGCIIQTEKKRWKSQIRFVLSWFKINQL